MKRSFQIAALAIALALGASAVRASPQFSTPVVLPGDTTLAPPAGDQTNVAFARGAGLSLMVWEDTRAALAGTQDSHGYDGVATRITDVYAARIDDAGQPIDTLPIRVTKGAFSQTVPKVAWNGQNWLVVWTSRTAGPSFSTQGVYGARISASGQVLDDPPILISDTTGFDERMPVVASDGNRWAVVWFANIAFGTDGVRGCLVDSAGMPDAPRTFFQSAGGVNYYVPSNFELAWAGGRYLLVSEHMSPSRFDEDIFGQLFDATLTKVGGEFNVSMNTWAQNHSAIASNGASFFVTWYDDRLPPQVRGSPVSSSGIVTVPDGTVFESPPSDVDSAAGWDGATWIAAWRDYGEAMSYPIHAARVSGAGAMLPGSPFTVSAGNWSMERPAICTLANGVLVGWSDLRNVHFFFSNSPAGMDTTDLYGVVVDGTGSVAPDRPLQLSPPAQTRPDVAGNAASGYLVTYLSETAGTASVMAQRIDALGLPVDPQPIVVASGTRLIRNPAVAFDGTRWLVTWGELSLNGSSGSGNVFARRVGSNGTAIDGAPILVMPGNTPDVAAVGGIFLVVSTTNPGHFQSIQGARVRGSDGVVLDGSPLSIGSYFSVDPSVTAFADRWLVAWQQHPSHDDSNSDIRTSFVLASGAPVGQVVITSSGRAPSVTSGGSSALVSWNSGSDIRARRIQSNGTMLDTLAGFVVSNALNAQFTPESGWDGGRWLVAWNDYRGHANVLDGGVGDLYGARVEAGGTVSDPAGSAVAVDFTVPECNPAIAGDLGTGITAYAMVRVEPPYGTFRITLRGSNSSFSAFCFSEGGLATPCPCANSGAAGHGCANSRNADGAVLSASGAVNPDTVVLTSIGELPTALSIFLQGDAVLSPGVAFGDGVRCTGGSLKRLAVRNASGGTVSFPRAGDPSITARSAALGDPISAGAARHYQTYYRDPSAAFCPGATFNVSNAIRIDW
jgi:hypothetical protein